jgi:hypothetical protein
MRPLLGAALLALASAPFAAPADAVVVARPAYLNIVVDSPQSPQQPPRFRVERVDPAGSTALSPRVSCWSKFDQQQVERPSFTVTCVPEVEEDVAVTDDVRVSGRRCENAGVRVEVAGPVPNEQVTGTITCGQPVVAAASCTATASLLDPLNGGFTGHCAQALQSGPMPISCHVDLSRVRYDRWQVTCYGTDP